MLAAIIILVLAAVLLYFGRRYLNPDAASPVKIRGIEETNAAECAIVFGKEDFAEEIDHFLTAFGIQPIHMKEIGFQKEWKNVQYLFAVSLSDSDNLSVCNLGQKFYHPKRILGICNHRENEVLYRKGGIEMMQPDHINKQIDRILQGKVCSAHEDEI